MGDDRQYAPATLRNRDSILDVLRDVLPMTGVILEVASGSGEHVVHFAKNFPALVFQPSDPDPEARLSVAGWVKATGVTNVRAPIALDALHSVWPIASVDGIICINMVHISAWKATLGLIKGAAAISLQDRRCISTVHTSAKGSQRPRATRHRQEPCWRSLRLASPGLLPPHHHRSRELQQRAGAGVRRFDRDAADRRVAVDHEQRGTTPPAELVNS
jgi:Protein of unknown function (DUF938)